MISIMVDQDGIGIDEPHQQDPDGSRPPTGGVRDGLRRPTAGIEGTGGKAAPDPDEEMAGAVTALHEDRSTAATKRMLVSMEALTLGGMKGSEKNRGKPLEDLAPSRRQPLLRRGTASIEDRDRPRQARRWRTGAQQRRALRQARAPRPASSEQRVELGLSSVDRANSICIRSEISMRMPERDQFLDSGSWTCSARWTVRWSTRRTKTRSCRTGRAMIN